MCWFQERKQKQPPDRFWLSFRLFHGFDLILIWFWYGLDTMSKRCCHDDLMICVDLFDLIFRFFSGGSGGLVSKKVGFRDNFVWSIVLSFVLVWCDFDGVLILFWCDLDAIQHQNHDFNLCQNHAWNQIKSRTRPEINHNKSQQQIIFESFYNHV